MLDLRQLLKNIEESAARLATRGPGFDLDELADLDDRRRRLVSERDGLRYEQKQVSMGFKRPGVTDEQRDEIRARSKELSGRIADLDAQATLIDERIREVLLGLPNLPHPSVPIGVDETENPEIRRVLEPPSFDFEPRPHYDLGEALGILDFESAGKISGSRQVVYRDAGARLERALASFMLDVHVAEHGYREVLTPYMVTLDCMVGTGQLPKFRDDAYAISEDFFLIPTAEVPVTNLHRGEI
ncbi:MAG: serine--tRNA ligase, partial [Deltaproteobacteria bacterium]|nr:serine--tRNA ligase [Deltaproteobacteria bacterium]